MTNLCASTPRINIRDNRGLNVRTLRYNRGTAGAVAAQYVDTRTHNVLGQATSSQDPRFFGSPALNLQYTPALSGQVLKTVSADAGTSKACADVAGRPVWNLTQGRDAERQSDSNITVQWYYDALDRPVQRVRHTAEIPGGGPLGGVADIWCYGDYSGPSSTAYDLNNAADPRNANLRGQMLRHFDTAGLIDVSARGYAVLGTVLRQDRRFLDVPCDSTTRWTPGSPQALYGLNKQWLESDTDPANLYSTWRAYNALGQILTQADAKGHQQHTAYDGAGRKYTTSVTPNGGTLTPVCAGITYTAAGAIDTRSDANHIQVAHVYEPQTTQRLISITATRVSTKLQALTYAYDGVGNVVSLSDSSAGAQVSFFRNHAVTPDRGYTYDALYQLTSATGRENYVNRTPKGTDWPGGQFNPAATPEYQAYTRSYTYDAGGNLTTIRSANWSDATPPTRQLVVGSASNRAMCTTNNPGATQANIDTYFDLAGKNICLDANRNQPMYWTTFHQLYCVVTTYRPPSSGGVTGDWSDSDREQYAYGGNGQRVRKYASSMASGNWNHLDTRYLPGLELRGNSASGENLEVIVLDDGARVLNWAGGAGKPNDIPNLQLRFQYADRQNSCQIETDSTGNVITQEEYYPYGGTAVLTSRSNSEVKYKTIRYSGKERDATGLYYYGLRYYQPWIGRWINPDPAGPTATQNLYCMVSNNPVTWQDRDGLMADRPAPAQEQAPRGQPLRPRIPRLPSSSYKALRLLEAGLRWLDSGLLKWNPRMGVTLDVSQGDSGPALWHPFDRQYQQGDSIYSKKWSMQSPLRKRIYAMGLTVIQTLAQTGSGITGRAGAAAASYSLPTYASSAKGGLLSLQTYKYIVLPLLLTMDNKSTANSFENVAAFATKNPADAAALAREATMGLVAARATDDLGLPRGNLDTHAGKIWNNEMSKITAKLEYHLLGKSHNDGQDFLYDLIIHPETRPGVIAALLEPPAPVNDAQAPANEPAATRKRKASPADESAAGTSSPSSTLAAQYDPSQPGPSWASAPSPSPWWDISPSESGMQSPSNSPLPRQASPEYPWLSTPELMRMAGQETPAASPMPEQASPEDRSLSTPDFMQVAQERLPMASPTPRGPVEERFSPPATPPSAQGAYYPAQLASTSWASMAPTLTPGPWSAPYSQNLSGQQSGNPPPSSPLDEIEATIPGDAATVEETLSAEQPYQLQAYQQGHSHGYWGM
ncbi:RHS repeat domain-containing protein [Bordetella sp. LUAb4]|uniref:RHS repeat domain-containing protein n=1 Tax=Bordetella sp. LUAb4 TaxID=2843195 RepID=UPI001E2D8448|nr:RHS repeat-associated core domain-containing protein [Bordetella sp. LUAb4]